MKMSSVQLNFIWYHMLWPVLDLWMQHKEDPNFLKFQVISNSKFIQKLTKVFISAMDH